LIVLSSNIRALVALVCLFATTPLVAQEFDIFDPSDFLDPRERGAVFTPDGFDIFTDGKPYILLRAYVGGIHDYQWRIKPTDSQVGFAHLVASAYKRNLQGNVKFTMLRGDADNPVPEWRIAGQFAYYMGPDATQKDDTTSRLLLSAAIEENGFKRILQQKSDHYDLARGEPAYNLEFSGQFDSKLGSLDEVQGSIVVTYRRPGPRPLGDDRREAATWRASYFYRTGFQKEQYFATANVGFGWDKVRNWSSPIYRGVLMGGVAANGHRPGITFGVAPTYLTSESRWFTEFTLFVDTTIWSRLGRLRLPESFTSDNDELR
jgi:hypothetical protein